jgi:hypothetical protein
VGLPELPDAYTSSDRSLGGVEGLQQMGLARLSKTYSIST